MAMTALSPEQLPTDGQSLAPGSPSALSPAYNHRTPHRQINMAAADYAFNPELGSDSQSACT